jgi:hypothetical protein
MSGWLLADPLGGSPCHLACVPVGLDAAAVLVACSRESLERRPRSIARLRRLSPLIIEASYDLGADSFQTFRYVVLSNLGTALLAGGMLAFALSSTRSHRHHLHGGPADEAAHLDVERARPPPTAVGH